VGFTLCAALLINWLGAPGWVPKALAVGIGGLAAVLIVARGNRRRRSHARDLGFENEMSWIQYELAGKGSPKGLYLLAFFCLLVMFLTGFNTDYAMPAWAAAALSIAWGIANASYPVDEEDV